MSLRRRVQQEPAWILHQRPFRDSSQILDILSKEHGRLAVVARGSRSARSKLRGVLRPFLPLQLSWVIRSDLGTLTGAEMDGPPLSLVGEALLSGYYVNELILTMLHRHDPQPEIFDAYGQTIRRLVGNEDIAEPLRRFEIELLRMLGYALNLDHDTDSQAALRPESKYEYRPERGPVPVAGRDGPLVFSGAELAGIRDGRFDEPAILRAAGRLLRQVIAYHLDGRELKSRQVLKDLRQARSAR